MYAKQHEMRRKIVEKPKQKAFLTLFLHSLWVAFCIFGLRLSILLLFFFLVFDLEMCAFGGSMCGRLKMATVAPAFPVDRAPIFFHISIEIAVVVVVHIVVLAVAALTQLT